MGGTHVPHKRMAFCSNSPLKPEPVMKRVEITAPGVVSWVDHPKPEAGPKDVLLKIKACGICGSDSLYTDHGGIPPYQGCTPLGHEPAGEVAEIGAGIESPDVEVGDHVVVDTMVFQDGLLGSGGAQGALSIPWHIAALNEPMAVALHAVNRTSPKPGCKVVVFGAGPIGLGAVLGYRRKGASHIVVVDVVNARLEKALKVGADAVVNSAEAEDLAAKLVELQGDGATAQNRGTRPGTDIFLDAAGAPPVPAQVCKMAKRGATFGIVIAPHKVPVTC
ncbi:alcohol dehydrogenase [Colletotrichum lupini]|uniref:Alcohol dehydrogenase n=1 Tax=Colletotrichum lupini TaxID=145971 RepID=A0A9Q8SZD9_9PEZI|nr:alcohol dehydrogenase [Colletotrichum lupini]UQC86307.1 alcohol dehydrogenase [Colletotrichum lupini]